MHVVKAIQFSTM